MRSEFKGGTELLCNRELTGSGKSLEVEMVDRILDAADLIRFRLSGSKFCCGKGGGEGREADKEK